MSEDVCRRVGRYLLAGEIASGGIGRVYFGRLLGVAGFSRPVAIKRLHAQYVQDPEFVSMLLDEARLAGRVRHPNVVQTLDVLEEGGEVFIVMDYVDGESLSRLVRASRQSGEEIPFPIIAALGAGMLHGLHAAHEANDSYGRPLGLVHRDVSPENVVVGADGLARVIDFGVAKAAGRMRASREGQMKGKFAYMAPEQLRGEVTRRTDIFAAGIVLWEAITQRNLFKERRGGIDASPEAVSMDALLHAVTIAPKRPSEFRPDVPHALEEIVLRALRADPAERFASAREMALEIESALSIAAPSTVGAWVERLVADRLHQRRQLVADIEARSIVTDITSNPSNAPAVTPLAAAITNDVESAPAVAAAPSPLPPLRRAVVLLALAAVASVAGIAAFVAGRTRPPVEQVVANVPGPVSSTTSSGGPVTAAVSGPKTSVEPPSAPQRSGRPIGGSTVRPSTRQSQSTRPPVSCNPPYEVGPSGHHQYKKECL